MSAVHTRIAPSPTGMFHVGTARVALVNWAYARHNGGDFLLRIEDTDTKRNDEDAVRGIFSALEWLGLDWDETPVFQSERRVRHAEVADTLFATGHAYWCGCPAVEAKSGKGYSGVCRDRGLSRAPGRLLRFRVEPGDEVVFDLVKGETHFDRSAINDFSLARADGSVMFMLANVVDDADTGVSVVIRGEDHLSNTAKYQMIWRALDFGAMPAFAHLPLLVRMGENGSKPKLSKRRDRVAIEDFRDAGFLPSAMMHYLAELSYRDIEGDSFDLESYARSFDIGSFNSSPAVFDEAKLRSINADHIRGLSEGEYISMLIAFDGSLAGLDLALLASTQTRVVTLAEAVTMVSFVRNYSGPDEDALAALAKAKNPVATLDRALAVYGDIDWNVDALHAATLDRVCAELEMSLSKVQMPLRVAVTGRRVGPPLFEAIASLSREEALRRIAELRDICRSL